MKTLHDGIAALLAKIEAEHGIVVESLETEWTDVSTMDEPPRARLRALRIVTVTVPRQ